VLAAHQSSTDQPDGSEQDEPGADPPICSGKTCEIGPNPAVSAGIAPVSKIEPEASKKQGTWRRTAFKPAYTMLPWRHARPDRLKKSSMTAFLS
jgi:hypothetical protein